MTTKVDLTGKVTLIAGATGGVGRSVVRAFHDAGARLTLVSRSHDRLGYSVPVKKERATHEEKRKEVQGESKSSSNSGKAFQKKPGMNCCGLRMRRTQKRSLSGQSLSVTAPGATVTRRRFQGPPTERKISPWAFARPVAISGVLSANVSWNREHSAATGIFARAARSSTRRQAHARRLPMNAP